MIVVDASVILEILLRSDSAAIIEERIFESEVTLHAPHLIDLEIAQVVGRYLMAGGQSDPFALARLAGCFHIGQSIFC